MAALATIFNRLVPNEQKLLTFWTNSDGDLSLTQRRNPLESSEIAYQNVAQSTGLVKNPSSLTALLLKDVINVYGVTAAAGDNSATLKRLSPMVETIAKNISIEQAASLAGITNPDQSSGWLYYLSVDEDEEAVITEYKIGSRNDPSMLKDLPRPNTYIAAAYYTSPSGVKERRVIFQTKKQSELFVVDTITKENNEIKGSDIAKTPSPIAAVTAKTAAGVETVYVYFVDSTNNLQCSSYGEMSSPAPVRVMNATGSAPPVADWSQLAVTAGAKYNFISYVTDKGGEQFLTIFADERV